MPVPVLLVALSGLLNAEQAGTPPVALHGLTARSIGPATMGGRVTALAVLPSNPDTQYVGTAAGGLWKTSDDGRSWQCVFPGSPHPSIGAVAVAPSDPRIVYVGTGEANARNSVSWGNGVFVSKDAGQSWTHVGLRETHHIGRIVVHPRQPEVAYVAALGHLWGANRERGLFGTRDGGKTWTHLFALDQDTGCVDVVLDPTNPNTLFVAAFRVRRDDFSGGNPATQFGPKAGIYRSRDAGKTWTRLSKGLPTRPLGRIGLHLWAGDSRYLTAVVPTDRTDIAKVAGQPAGSPGSVETGGIFVSNDGGDSWQKINNLCPRPFYFGQVRVDPTDARRIWVLGIPLFFSTDGGRNFSSNGAPRVHVDHHDLWINPADPRHLILGNDGGLYYSRSGGKDWIAVKNLPISQFYGLAVDSRVPYRVYGGLQDNGSWGGLSRTSNPVGIRNSDWFRIYGMDGFQCAVAPDDPYILFAEGQYGRLVRIDGRTLRATSIRPQRPKGDNGPSYRFNWNSPLALSPHDPKTLYYGGQYVFRSPDRGQTWQVISPDLTAGKPGVALYSHTLTALAESPRQAGLLYAGSDDGRVHVSRDAGKSWVEVTGNLPGVKKPFTVTRLEPSPFRAGTVFLSLDRHRQDDRAPYLFRSDDYGATWRSLASRLPAEGHVHVIRADARNPDLLYVGTEFGLFVSLDEGANWQPLGHLPPCPVHDVVVQPRERELVIGTHGRGIYVLEVAGLQELTAQVRSQPAVLLSLGDAVIAVDNKPQAAPERTYVGQNPAHGARLRCWLGTGIREARLEILSASGDIQARIPVRGSGFHQVIWDLHRTTSEGNRQRVQPGEYTVQLIAGTHQQRKTFWVRKET
jgi:photosystem II stability/assembly factor-like uncharacterized protein